mgnify:CR=1 FL=1
MGVTKRVVRQYKNNGYNIVLDVCSGSVHVVDDLVYDMIALYEGRKYEEIEEMYLDKIRDMLLSYCEFMDEMNDWRSRLLRW